MILHHSKYSNFVLFKLCIYPYNRTNKYVNESAISLTQFAFQLKTPGKLNYLIQHISTKTAIIFMPSTISMPSFR